MPYDSTIYNHMIVMRICSNRAPTPALSSSLSMAQFSAKLEGVQPADFIGGTAGTRTQDQSLKRALLYQLSYRPDRPRIIAELAR